MNTVIVGAGLAGLYVARELSKTGPVIILDKYTKVGGRINTGHDGTDNYEIGAGRIHSSHKRVLSLVKEYGLKTFNIGGTPKWRAIGGPSTVNHFEPAWMALLTQIRKLPASILSTSTLRELSEKILGHHKSRMLLEMFPYRTELEHMRADLGIKAFDDTLGTQENYSVVAGGLEQLIGGLVRDITKRGGIIHVNTTVKNVTESNGVYTVTTSGQSFESNRIVLCLDADAYNKLPVTRGLKALEYVDMANLIRIYAKYPPGWFTGDDRTVTDSPLRYIIPINPASGLIMISYTDGRDTYFWKSLKGTALTNTIQDKVHELFPERNIPEPTWVKPFVWRGTTYWKPGNYDPVEESKKVLQPRPSTMPELYLCGESFSLLQAWMEGSLEHADQLLELIRGRS
jgi:monoamine oxidase